MVSESDSHDQTDNKGFSHYTQSTIKLLVSFSLLKLHNKKYKTKVLKRLVKKRFVEETCTYAKSKIVHITHICLCFQTFVSCVAPFCSAVMRLCRGRCRCNGGHSSGVEVVPHSVCFGLCYPELLPTWGWFNQCWNVCELFPQSAGGVGRGEGYAGLPQQGRGPPLRSGAVMPTFDMVVL